MFSCDTMAVSADFSKYGQNILAKNSDRPTGEPQPLCFYQGHEYAEGEVVHTTYLDIPQVRKTYAVVGSRPYWIWGFEMGYNEMGLVIGNEAEGSRMEPETEDGLLGMDILRLALERAATAREGIEVITDLLKKYGQKARASMLTARYYENTFILTDKTECWVLETAGREWIARQIKTQQGISNCYSIGTEYDMASENIEKIARENRWISPGEEFDFAKAYSGHLAGQAAGAQRYRRLNKLLAQSEKHDFNSLAAILRDHYDGELISPRFGETSGIFKTICMHAAAFGDSETSASLLARYDEDLGIIARYAPAQVCLSAYIPVYMTDLPEMMQKADKKFDENSLWWQVKVLDLLVSIDEEHFCEDVRRELADLEEIFENLAVQAESIAKRLVKEGSLSEAKEVLHETTNSCAELLFDFAKRENKRLAEIIKAAGGLYGRQKELIEKYVEYSEIKLF